MASVKTGPFTEYIPASGDLVYDSISNTIVVRAELSELIISRIEKSMKAVGEIDDTLCSLEISAVYPTITNGRFTIDLNFIDEFPQIDNEKSLRLLIYLSEPRQALLLPRGKFYHDTEGKSVFVVVGENRAVRRRIKLGRKNSEYYEVLDGLNPGEQVIISSYRQFKDRKLLDVEELKKSYL